MTILGYKLKSWILHPKLVWEAYQRCKFPVVNLDDTGANCLICGFDHKYMTKRNKKSYLDKHHEAEVGLSVAE